MHVVLVGDVHLGWENTNEEAFRDFIKNELRDINPDKFILNGDTFELWRSSYGSVMVEYGDIINELTEIHRDGIDVIPIVGNHDWDLINIDPDKDPIANEPWSFREQYYFESGGEEFVATHGHEADPLNRNPRQNRALCRTDSDTGDSMDSVWDIITDSIIWEGVTMPSRSMSTHGETLVSRYDPVINRPNIRSISHLSNPDALTEPQNQGRYNRMINDLKKTYDETILGSHTHKVVEEEDYYNPGSWTGTGRYISVKDGNVNVDNS